ncbi:MAG: ABC transporter permease [Dehalococcoidia bacterium]|nr:ABC transporter permease [Dehalococcoidia bacterium]
MPEDYPKIRPQWVQWGIVIGIVAILEFISRAGLVKRGILVPPTEMFFTLGTLILSNEVTPHFIRTMIEAFASFAIAAVLGVAIGIFFWRFARVGKMFEPYIVSIYAMPLVMFYPLLLVFLGLGSLPIIVIAMITSVIPVILNTTIGFIEIREVLHKVARSNRCTPWQTFSKVFFPAAAPFIFTGLKLGFIYALVVTIGMEFILTDRGVGFQVHQYYDLFNSSSMYAYIVLILIIAVAANALLFRGEETLRRERT